MNIRKHHNKWQARIWLRGRNFYRSFDSRQEAQAALDNLLFYARDLKPGWAGGIEDKATYSLDRDKPEAVPPPGPWTEAVLAEAGQAKSKRRRLEWRVSDLESRVALLEQRAR